MPDFESREFVAVAEEILTSPFGESQAHLRTVVGRSYYGAYGVLRRALIQRCNMDKFGTNGKHKALIRICVAPGNPQLHALGQLLKTLEAFRTRADYEWAQAADITMVEAEDAIDAARDALAEIDALHVGDLHRINSSL